MYEAALALSACLPEGEKVERNELYANTARELGFPKANREARRLLNKALNTEYVTGRLVTEWQRV